MEKDKSTIQQHQIGGLPPRFQSSNASAQSSSPLTTIAQSPNQGVGGSDDNRFSHDLSRMADLPPKNLGHRRAHSEILCLPDDISFDSDLGVVGSGDGPSLSDETEEDLFSMYIDMEKFNSSSATSGDASAVALAGESGGSSERPRIRHQHSQSMDGSTSIQPELLVSGSEGASLAESKKAMSAAKLADLALIDPKRAKRIWANRQSAARSKERKMRYIAELERKVQTLQTEATTLSAQLSLLQRDTTGLTAENNELKLRLQTMEQQVHLQDALNDALREEVQRLKLVTGQTMSGAGPMNFGQSFNANQQFYPNNHAMHTLLAAQQFQQLQIHSQQQQQQSPQQQALQFQQQQQQQAHQLQHQTGELKLKGSSLPSPSQRDSTSESNSSSQEWREN